MTAEVSFEKIPRDSAAEAAFLGAIMISAKALAEQRQRVRASDFFLLAHRHIFAACVTLADQGQPVDLITVHNELIRNGTGVEAGGLSLLQEIVLATESAANADHYAGIIIRDSQLRQFLKLGGSIVDAAQAPNADPEDISARLLMSYEASLKRSAATLGLAWQLPVDILAPVPPVPWVVPGLHLAPGRPCIVAGYGASAKTLSCQAMAVAAAAGIPVWGHFEPARALRIRHVDSEQGDGATRRRYRRLAYALGVGHEHLGDRLQMVSFPGIYLSGKGAEAAWKRVADGADIIILDSLRALTPGVDENSSEMRRHLDPLTRISEATGAVFVIIHHAGKTPSDPSAAKREGRQQLRGSSGIFDAAGSVFLLKGAGNEPKKMEQVKAPADAEGGALDPFWLTVEDITDGSNDRAGVRVLYHAENPSADVAAAPLAKIDRLREQIVAVIQERPGISGNMLRQSVGGRVAAVLETLSEMVNEGKIKRIVREGRGAGDAYFLI